MFEFFILCSSNKQPQ